MNALDYGDCRVSVFRRVSEELYDWYREASDDEREATGSHIIVEERIPEDVLWARLELT